MSRIALHQWQDRIAPVFDVGGRILLLAEGVREREEHVLSRGEPLHRAEDLLRLDVGTLICGAISRPMQEALVAGGIKVVGFVTGDLERVITAWERGDLDESFDMPGCRGRGLGRQRGMQQQSRRADPEPSPARTGSGLRSLDGWADGEPGCARIRNRRGRDLRGGPEKDSGKDGSSTVD
ncbi:putative Fe-Mo cluster-binding NifX family protein [Desulfomicrobium macestii]|uniref:Dinitrogenase iron-molybdenum cofactor n=2 Tax=Desulfomicrobium TaxID=898 RepID=A0A8G2C0N9_DESNO|nr:MULTISPECIES: NifB/NifX family molybdenum-iron cluster-binding protein [Desulfomicrobium]MBE1424096.1 putative Fe-Mo cluster-binding NifX family protein [Desulfomicrobium macestii]SFL31020.1 Dinitrogenase iron-molybdenum cofactor [Desulfomicrobium norvegicum]